MAPSGEQLHYSLQRMINRERVSRDPNPLDKPTSVMSYHCVVSTLSSPASGVKPSADYRPCKENTASENMALSRAKIRAAWAKIRTSIRTK